MSASHLPEDLARWPSDPFAVLGVERHADSKAIKGAYTQLLRCYKPERVPQHFQRLREAYEKASALAQWRERYRVEIESHDDDGRTEYTEHGDGSLVSLGAEEGPSSRMESSRDVEPAPRIFPVREIPVRINDVPAAWREAAEGKTAQAYQRLVDWHARGGEEESNPQHWKGYAQLYWLLTLYPNLSPDSSAVDWLTLGLEKSSAARPLLELFRREIERDASEAFRPAVEALLGKLPPQALANVLALRWKARQERCEHPLILAELEQVRHKVAMNHAAWGELLIAAMEGCMFWVPPHDPALRHLVEELGTCAFSGQFGARLDRLDLFQHVSDEWTELQNSNLPRSWFKLIGEYYNWSYRQRTSLLEQITADIAKAPLQALHDLDFLTHHFPAAAAILLEMLERHCWHYAEGEEGEVWDVPSELPPRLAGSLRQNRSYELVRQELVEWSLAEFVTPASTAALVQSLTSLDLSEDIAQDRSFHCVYAAWSAYWSVAASGAS